MILDQLRHRTTAHVKQLSHAISALEDEIRTPPPLPAPQGHPSGAGIWVMLQVRPEDRQAQELRQRRRQELHAQSVQAQRLQEALAVGNDPSQEGQRLAFRRAKIPRSLLSAHELEAASEAAAIEPGGTPVRIITTAACWHVFKPEPGGWSLFSVPRHLVYQDWREALANRPSRPSSPSPPSGDWPP